MPKAFKIILCAIALIIIGAAFVARILPKPKMSFTDKQELYGIIARLNSDLPDKIGTIGQLEEISFDDSKIITYHISIFGDSSIDKFYKENFDEIGVLMKYGVISLNGQHNTGTNLAKLLENKGINLCVDVKTPSNQRFQWNYTGKELSDFIPSLTLTPTEALHTVITTEIKLANLSLPVALNDFGDIHSVAVNALQGTIAQGDRLLEILYHGNEIIFVCETSEQENTVAEIRKYLNNPLFIENFVSSLSEDADIAEFINMLVLAHSEMTYRIKNVTATDSIDITVPYTVLKNKCSIKLQNLL